MNNHCKNKYLTFQIRNVSVLFSAFFKEIGFHRMISREKTHFKSFLRAKSFLFDHN